MAMTPEQNTAYTVVVNALETVQNENETLHDKIVQADTANAAVETQRNVVTDKLDLLNESLVDFEAAFTDTTPPTDPPPTTGYKIPRGVIPWVASQQAGVDYAAFMQSDLFPGGASIFTRPRYMRPDPNGAFNLGALEGFIKARNQYAPTRKIAFMMIPGTQDTSSKLGGLTAAWMAGIPDDEIIVSGRGTYPAFWSPVFNARIQKFYTDMPSTIRNNIDSIRINPSWGPMGEPWGLHDAVAEYIKKAKAFGLKLNDGTLVTTEDHLAIALREAIVRQAEMLEPLFPKAIFVLATGYAFGPDNVSSLPDSDPNKHPWYVGTIKALRDRFAGRPVRPQHNGGNDSIGASGYGAWLSATYGPGATRYAPGASYGVQAIGGCVQDVKDPPRLSPVSKMNAALSRAKNDGAGVFELYYHDANAALKNTAGDGQAMAAHIRSLGTW